MNNTLVREAGAAGQVLAPLPFIDLEAQRERLGNRIEQAVLRVLRHGAFLGGPEILELEQALAQFAGCNRAISVGSGTAALDLVLRAWQIGPGDAVFLPSFTFIASASTVVSLGAVPVFVDIDADSFNLSLESLQAALPMARAQGLVPRAIMTVDLFGQPADYGKLEAYARQEGLRLLCDAAQSFGASHNGKRTGTFGDATVTSFYPAKPLGCYGDGGAVFCDDAELAELLVSLREYGKLPGERTFVRIGTNARMDTLQAAVLLEKLAIFPEELEQRQQVAARYHALLAPYHNHLTVPVIAPGNLSSWAQYTVRLRDGLRERVIEALDQAGVPSAIHYAVPPHLQPAYQEFPRSPAGMEVCERLAGQVLSLPMHPYLTEAQQERVVAALTSGLA